MYGLLEREAKTSLSPSLSYSLSLSHSLSLSLVHVYLRLPGTGCSNANGARTEDLGTPSGSSGALDLGLLVANTGPVLGM